MDPSVQRILSVFPRDADGDHLVQIREGDGETGIYIDARGVQVLLRALGEPTAERDSIPDPDNLDWNDALSRPRSTSRRRSSSPYDKGEGVIEQRRLFPKVSYAAPNGIVITGDDPDRDDVRAFRLDRIQGRGRGRLAAQQRDDSPHGDEPDNVPGRAG